MHHPSLQQPRPRLLLLLLDTQRRVLGEDGAELRHHVEQMHTRALHALRKLLVGWEKKLKNFEEKKSFFFDKIFILLLSCW